MSDKNKTLRVWGTAPAFELDIEPTDEEIESEMRQEYEDEQWQEFQDAFEREREGIVEFN